MKILHLYCSHRGTCRHTYAHTYSLIYIYHTHTYIYIYIYICIYMTYEFGRVICPFSWAALVEGANVIHSSYFDRVEDGPHGPKEPLWATTGSFVLSQTGGKGAKEWVTAWVLQPLKFEFPKVGGFWVSGLPLGLRCRRSSFQTSSRTIPMSIPKFERGPAEQLGEAEASWWCFQHPKAFVHRNIKRTEISWKGLYICLYPM